MPKTTPFFLAATLLVAAPLRSDDLGGKLVTGIRLEGLKHTKEHVVHRELASRVGEPYTPETLQRDREQLDRLRIFSSIRVSAIAQDDGVIVTIEVEETLSYLPTMSFQVSDDNGVSAGPGVKSTNFLGRGIELGASAQFGGSTNVDVFVMDPWVAGNHVSYEVQYLRRDRLNELDGFREIAHEPELRIGSFIGRSGRIGGLAAVSVIQSDRDGVTRSPSNRDTVTKVGGYLGYDTRDLWSVPRNGWWNELQITRSSVTDAAASFWTYTFDVRRYETWKERHTVVLTSLTTLQTGTLGVDIPIHADFHLGGTNTIRGFSLGSRSGKNQLINTVEYRYLLGEPRPVRLSFFSAYLGLQIAAFADWGQAWNEPNELALSQSIGGYGVGLRILVPFVDEVRLDVALGQPGEGATFHFGIYPKAVMQRLRVR